MKKTTLTIEVDQALLRSLRAAKIAGDSESLEEAAAQVIEHGIDYYLDTLEGIETEERKTKVTEKSRANKEERRAKFDLSFPNSDKDDKHVALLIRELTNNSEELTHIHAARWFYAATNFQINAKDNAARVSIDSVRKRFDVFFEQFAEVIKKVRMAHKSHGIDSEMLEMWHKELSLVMDFLEQERSEKFKDIQQADDFIGTCVGMLDHALLQIRHEGLTKEELEGQAFGVQQSEEDRKFAQRLRDARLFVTGFGDKNSFLDQLFYKSNTLDGALSVLGHLINQFKKSHSPHLAESVLKVLPVLTGHVTPKLKGKDGGRWVAMIDSVNGAVRDYLDAWIEHREALQEYEHVDVHDHYSLFGDEENGPPSDKDVAAYYRELSDKADLKQQTGDIVERATTRLGTSITLLNHLTYVVKDSTENPDKYGDSKGLGDMPQRIQNFSMIGGKAPTLSSLSNIYKEFGQMPESIATAFSKQMQESNEADGSNPDEYQRGFLFQHTPGQGGKGQVTLNPVFDDVPLDFIQTKAFDNQLKAMRNFFWSGRFESQSKHYAPLSPAAHQDALENGEAHIHDFVAIDEIYVQSELTDDLFNAVKEACNEMDPKPLWCASSDSEFLGNNEFLDGLWEGYSSGEVDVCCFRVLRKADQKPPTIRHLIGKDKEVVIDTENEWHRREDAAEVDHDTGEVKGRSSLLFEVTKNEKILEAMGRFVHEEQMRIGADQAAEIAIDLERGK